MNLYDFIRQDLARRGIVAVAVPSGVFVAPTGVMAPAYVVRRG